MNLNVLEYLGVIMIFFIVSITIVCLYYAIKDAFDSWKMRHRNKCPFCGAYLHGYQHRHKGTKFDAKYCSRCGKSLKESNRCQTCAMFDKDCDGVSGFCNSGVFTTNSYRKETTPDEIQN